MAGEPAHQHRAWEELREAAIQAEYETGVREESEREARAAIHVRLARMTLGSLLVLAGIAMLALPGPGWLTIAGGLAILAKDVAWAARALAWVRRRLPGDETEPVPTKVIVLSVVVAVVAFAGSIWWTFIR
jgi:uncharacterized protein (TIGR02611 family)